jgi:hypothetical protein
MFSNRRGTKDLSGNIVIIADKIYTDCFSHFFFMSNIAFDIIKYYVPEIQFCVQNKHHTNIRENSFECHE